MSGPGLDASLQAPSLGIIPLSPRLSPAHRGQVSSARLSVTASEAALSRPDSRGLDPGCGQKRRYYLYSKSGQIQIQTLVSVCIIAERLLVVLIEIQ